MNYLNLIPLILTWNWARTEIWQILHCATVFQVPDFSMLLNPVKSTRGNHPEVWSKTKKHIMKCLGIFLLVLHLACGKPTETKMARFFTLLLPFTVDHNNHLGLDSSMPVLSSINTILMEMNLWNSICTYYVENMGKYVCEWNRVENKGCEKIG